MVRLIDDLLDVSRITRGKLTPRKERVELRRRSSNTRSTLRARSSTRLNTNSALRCLAKP